LKALNFSTVLASGIEGGKLDARSPALTTPNALLSDILCSSALSCGMGLGL